MLVSTITRRLLVFVALATSPLTAHCDDIAKPSLELAGKVTDVTLFRQSALVTRTVDLPPEQSLQPGAHEIVVTGLPDQLVASSVYAEGNDTIAIRAVRVIREPVGESTREEVAKLDNQIAGLSEELETLSSEQRLVTANLRTLEQMLSFSREAADTDLNRGVLASDELVGLLDYSMDQRGVLNSRQLELARASKEIQTEISQLNRERTRLTGTDPKTRYLARVFIDKTGDANGGGIRLSYSVEGCNWSPQYTISGAVDSDEFQVRYGAIIGQLSGEPWDQVSLTLSTASPSVRASGPTLTPLRIAAVMSDGGQAMDDLFDSASQNESMGLGMGMDMGMGGAMQQRAMPSQMVQSGLKKKMRSLRSAQQTLQRRNNASAKGTPSTSLDLQLNSYAGQMQELEFQASASKVKDLATDEKDEVASQTYVIDDPVSLESKRDQQLVEIIDAKMSGDLYHVATPLLSSFAYREAEMTNDLAFGLLAGPASVYLDDRFVGMMDIPTTASGQLLRLGFGADGQVRTRRELVTKEDTVQGGNRRLSFDYKLVINNFKQTPIRVRLLDRIPLSSQTQQTRVTLGDVDPALSEDALYKRVMRPLGILRWDLELPASTHGSQASDITYNVNIEFDRSRKLSVPLSLQQPMPQEIMDGFMGGGGMGGGGVGGGGMGR